MSLLSLPVELITKIVHYLPLLQIARVMLVCRRLSVLCSSELFWKLLYQRDYPLYYPHLKCEYRVSYRCLFCIMSFNSDESHPDEHDARYCADFGYWFVEEINVDEIMWLYEDDFLGEDGRIDLLYPIPPYHVMRSGTGYDVMPDIRITVTPSDVAEVDKSMNKDFFYVTCFERAAFGSIPLPHASSKLYEATLLRSFLTSMKEKGFLLMDTGDDMCSISQRDVHTYPDIFY